MIIFHDPRSAASTNFVNSLTPGDYIVVDWSDPAQMAQYPNAPIRAFPSVLLTMSDGSLGFVDCTLDTVNITTYAQVLALDNTVNQVQNTDANGNPVAGTHPVAVSPDIQLVQGV